MRPVLLLLLSLTLVLAATRRETQQLRSAALKKLKEDIEVSNALPMSVISQFCRSGSRRFRKFCEGCILAHADRIINYLNQDVSLEVINSRLPECKIVP
ncbi:hypothetical protein GEMRC1_009290 [Eukaryota sp. GEM-RC1]